MGSICVQIYHIHLICAPFHSMVEQPQNFQVNIVLMCTTHHYSIDSNNPDMLYSHELIFVPG